nr:Ribosomal protein L41 [Ipomoea batatas]
MVSSSAGEKDRCSTLGLSWLHHRSRQDFPDRPFIYLLINDQFLGPYRSTSRVRILSSSALHGPLILSALFPSRAAFPPAENEDSDEDESDDVEEVDELLLNASIERTQEQEVKERVLELLVPLNLSGELWVTYSWGSSILITRCMNGRLRSALLIATSGKQILRITSTSPTSDGPTHRLDESHAAHVAKCERRSGRIVILTRNGAVGRLKLALNLTHSYKENAQFLSGSTVRINHIKRFRIFGPYSPIKPGPHIRHFSVGGVLLRRLAGEHAGAHGNSPEVLHDVGLVVGHVFPANRVAHFPAVTVHGPHELFQKLLLVRLGLALERQADDVVRHLFVEHGGEHGELDHENGRAVRVLLDRQADPTLPVTE